jgi:hypothetical protein
MKKVLHLVFALSLSLGFTWAVASGQNIETRGAISGQVTDQTGAAVPGATVKVTGPQTNLTTTSNNEGNYTVENLLPGTYTVRVEAANFKAQEVANVLVNVGKTSTQNVSLSAGNISEVVTVTAGASIDTVSTATNSNLPDQLFQNIPVARNVTGLFYLAPGVNDSLAGGRDNPSISGGSALDNLYVADGVNITDSAFGGIGTFSRSYGALGTGINTSFVKEVQVKTAGFEPQYGQSEGGIVNIITQSGTNDYHGAIYGYAQPEWLEATRLQPDVLRTNKAGELIHPESYDAGVDIGGPIIPKIKDKLFFFGSFNPTVRRNLVQGAQGSGLLTLLGQHVQRTRTYNYAGKIDWNINTNNTLSFSIFGDPSQTNKSSFSSLNIDNTTAFSVLDFGSRNLALRWNGTLTSSWTMTASLAQNKNHFSETGFDNFNQIVDRTQTAAGQRGSFVAIGRGFIEPTQGKTWRFDWSTQKIWTGPKWLGQHTLSVGYQYQHGEYAGLRDRSGPHWTVPATNATGTSLTALGAGPAIGQSLNVSWSLRPASSGCTLCPFMNVPGVGFERVFLRNDRGEYGVPAFDTHNGYNAYWGMDSIRFNKYVTANLGLRNEQEDIHGVANVLHYSFTDQWAPRIGVTVDPRGKGNTKIFYNYGRFFEYIPLDEAERSLSSELDFIGARFAPVNAPCTVPGVGAANCVVLNQFGTVTPIVDAAHLLNGAPGGTGTGIAISTQNLANPILPGTKLGFADEHTFGIEQQLPHDLILKARYIDRRLKRITEDAAVLSPEDYQNGLFGQVYFIGNINSKTDVAVNPIPHVFQPTFVGNPLDGNVASLNLPATCDPNLVDLVVTNSNGAYVGSVCYEPKGKNGGVPGSQGADGVPDGFPDPVHIYKALEIELDKRFSNNWQLLSNWRISSLRGNYEGHFRNDNGQTDPGISSLFDFTAGSFGLLGDQFTPGPLNTDRRHVVNVYGNYEFSKTSEFGAKLAGLNIGPGIHFETGVPISQLNAHPAYLNAGEVPIGGRGSLGRTPSFFRFDLHLNYPWHITEKYRLNFVTDFFNLFNNQKLRLPDQNAQVTVGTPNVDFLKPLSYYAPRNMRVGLRFEF